jgi:MFS family permease
MLSGNVLTALVFTLLAPVLTDIAAHFGTANGAFIAQMIMTMPGAGIIVGGVVGGLLVGRIGIRPALLGGLALFGVAGAGPLYIDGAVPLLLSRFVLGLSAATVQTALVTLITVSFDDNRRAQLIGYAAAIGYTAAITAMLASGALAEWGGWRAPAAIYLVALAILAVALASIRGIGRPAAPTRSPGGAFRRLLPLWPSYLLIPPLYAANYMLAIQFPFLLAANGVDSPAAKSWIMAASSLAAVGGAASSGFIRERFGQPRLFALMCLLLGTGEALIGLSSSAPLAVVGAAVAGLAGGMVLPTLVNMIIGQASADLRSAAIGFVYSAAYVGQFLNPVLMEPLRLAFGIHATFVAIGTLLAMAGGGILLRSAAGRG